MFLILCSINILDSVGGRKRRLWDNLDAAATKLVRGDNPEADLVEHINRAIEKDSNSVNPALLPGKPEDEPALTARVVADVCIGFLEIVGPPRSHKWMKRFLAAKRLDPITCDTPASLTVGVDDDSLGASASLARLLAHYPPELYRDGVFLALAGMEAEAWNYHAFVEGFHLLAENAHRAGFTLVAFPANLEKAFRSDFGIQSFGDETHSRDGWAAEAFLDLNDDTAINSVERTSKWLENHKTDGVLLCAKPDGRVLCHFYKGGAVTETAPFWARMDRQRLSMAAQELNPRIALEALGLPDLLEPGKFEIPTEKSFLRSKGLQ